MLSGPPAIGDFLAKNASQSAVSLHQNGQQCRGHSCSVKETSVSVVERVENVKRKGRSQCAVCLVRGGRVKNRGKDVLRGPSVLHVGDSQSW